ncbi:CoA transferase [Henriciella sp. AS95]|uniref:CaiB/BaiF CoA transferase family protein n=1 Tax=Henriciella sp. AS95 TaxID=3135782 RepID=UPI00317117DA
MKPGPCSGLRVIDMSALISGPYCSQILADLGAEVIRVETPGSDVIRHVDPIHRDMSAYFEQVNRGKKSVSIDVKSEQGREQVRALVRNADIFLENSRPGVMEKLGFGYEDLKALNSKLIYVSVCGFGADGPHKDRAAYDPVVQGVVGFMPLQGTPGAPQAIHTVIADKITAIWAANSVMAALLDKERNGEVGQKVVVNMVAAYAAFMLLENMDHHTFRDAEFPVVDRPVGMFSTLDTRDGRVIGMILQPKQCLQFCTALGVPDLALDPRFGDAMSIVRNTPLLYKEVAPIVSAMSTQDFLALMSKHSVPFGPVNDIATFMQGEEALHAGAYTELEDGEYGAIRHLNFPASFSRSAVGPRGRAPRLGEHNAELLGSPGAGDKDSQTG